MKQPEKAHTNDFDQAARYAAKMDPAGFFRWLLAELAAALEFREWLDTRRLPLPREADRTDDLVAGFANSADVDHPWAIIVEFETEPRKHMLIRALDYVGRLLQELRRHSADQGEYDVGAVIVYLTGQTKHIHLEMPLPGMTAFGLRFQPVSVMLANLDARTSLAAIAAGALSRAVLPWIPLMRGGAENDIIEMWKQLAIAEADGWRRDVLSTLAVIFAELVNQHATWLSALEGWNVRKSLLFEEARNEGKRNALLRVLQLRFPPSIPKDLLSIVAEIKDADELSRWFDAAVTAPSLEAFRHAIGLVASTNGHA